MYFIILTNDNLGTQLFYKPYRNTQKNWSQKLKINSPRQKSSYLYLYLDTNESRYILSVS